MEENNSIKDKAKEFKDNLKELSEKLELQNNQKIIGIDFKDNIKLGGNLERNSIFVVTIQDKKGVISHIVIDSDVNKIATIDKNGKIELSPKEMQVWERFIGKKGSQNVEQKKKYDFEKEYYLEEYKTIDSLETNKGNQRSSLEERR